jgi:uncharacterized protein YbcI
VQGSKSPAETRGELLAAISSRMVQLLKQALGKGPDKARTYYEDDLVVVLLRGGFSRLEETLLQAGRGEAVTEQRRQLQEAMRGPFSQAVSELTGREVVAFMSGTHQRPDVMAEIFLLAPGHEAAEGRDQEAFSE